MISSSERPNRRDQRKGPPTPVRALMVFIDGLGIGERDREKNPMARAATPWFSFFQDGVGDLSDPSPLLRSADASLGVEGIPQSATGQTALFTGINAARLLGRHVNGFCTRELGAVLEGHSLFARLLKMGKRPTFANAYTPPFFEGKMRFQSVTTAALSGAGLPFRSLDDLREGKALYQDFTNRILEERGYQVPLFSPQEAGRVLAEIATQYDFTLYEYFQTDIAGHSQDMERCRREIEKIDAFIGSILGHLDLKSTCLIVISDHGNMEDLSTSGHTANPVPALLWGWGRKAMASRITSIADVTPALLELFQDGG